MEERELGHLPTQNWGWASLVAFGGALVLAAALFLIIPFTQLFEDAPEPDLVVREIKLAAPPPPRAPPPPEEAPPPPPEPELVTPPDEPPPIDIQTLDVALSPGSGEAIAMGSSVPVFQLQESMEAIEKMFTFDDLPEAPRLVTMPRFRFPASLTRRGIEEGKVIVEIDILPDGTVRFRQIVSSSHRELEAVAREIVRQARFTPPVIDGQPQTVRGRFPLLLKN